MKKHIFLILVVLLSISSSVFSQDKLKITPFIHQTGMYYSSDYITSDGFGLGAGVDRADAFTRPRRSKLTTSRR